MAKIKVVTIGRLYCSGGSEIGRLTAKKLGVPCYDREIVEMAAKRSGIPMEAINRFEESILSTLKTPISFFSKESRDITERIFAAETQVVMELAEKGPCVIVGRCADFILKNKVRTLNVFIYSSKEKRMAKAMGPGYEIPADEVEARLRKYDRKRRDYYNINTTKKWGERESYDLMLDSGKLGYELCAETIAHAAEAAG